MNDLRDHFPLSALWSIKVLKQNCSPAAAELHDADVDQLVLIGEPFYWVSEFSERSAAQVRAGASSRPFITVKTASFIQLGVNTETEVFTSFIAVKQKTSLTTAGDITAGKDTINPSSPFAPGSFFNLHNLNAKLNSR